MNISFEDLLPALREKLPPGDLHIGVLTSCTGEKSYPRCLAPLTLAEMRDLAIFTSRCAELERYRKAAEELYTGQHHARLMRAVRLFRAASRGQLDLRILSAGFGLLRAEQKIVPYEVTFNGMHAYELREWAHRLGIPDEVESFLAKKHDLKIIALGEKYLDACQTDWATPLGGLTVVLCGKKQARRIPPIPRIYVVGLDNDDAAKFRCGSIALKGELAGLLLRETIAVRRAS